MRLSQHFGRTLREAPADADMTSHQLIMRAGLARPLAAGIWSYLPLGWRVIRRLEAILREEMDAIGGQEVSLPVLQPSDIWEASGRWETFGPALQRLKNREGREFALGPTHEEVVAHLALREIESYKDLPRVVYQIQTKVRDEPRARGGLIRLREFIMKDAYSMHVDVADLDAFYPNMYQAYLNVFERCDLDVLPVEADSGLMGGSASHEFVLPHPDGEDRFVHCENCDYASNIEAAAFERTGGVTRGLAPLEKVATPDCKTIAELCAFLGITPEQTLKAVFYMADERKLVFALIRGDLDISETKLANAIGANELRAAYDDEIEAAGAVAGYASPVGLKVRSTPEGEGVLVAADPSIQAGANFVTGANKDGYHLTGANAPRDFSVTLLVDIAEPPDGGVCTRCGGTLRIERAIELGHCFKLGTRYSEPVGATCLDANGDARPIVMGSYGIGLDRLLAAIIETHHDDYGIIWPRSIAPYGVHLAALARDEAAARTAERLFAELQAAGIATLYDDRSLSPGVMFADADLIGIPLRITVSKRSLEAGGLEVKWRHEAEREVIPLEGAVEQIREWLGV